MKVFRNRIRMMVEAILLAFLGGLILSQCKNTTGSDKRTGERQELWSVKMARSVMARHDTLLYYTGREHVNWSYDVAFLGMAIDRLGDLDVSCSKYMEQYMDYFIRDDGEILEYDREKYNLDYVNPAKNLITLYKRTGDEKYKTAIGLIIQQLQEQPRTRSGGFWHKKIYPWQMWLDGIYMASPFMAQYAREFNKPRWADEMVYQVLLIYEKTLDPGTHLLYHAWDESRTQQWCNPETGQSGQFWGRAMGWYLMAIVDALDFLPEEHPGRERLLEILSTTSEALLKVRDPETGLWYQVLDQGGRKDNYLEGSASAMYTYVFARAANHGYLDASYLARANQSFDGILENLIRTDRDGYLTMMHIVGGCGLGGDPYRDGSYEYYVTEKQVNNDPKGVAPFILAALELNR